MRELLKHTYIVTVKPKTQSTVQTSSTFFPFFCFFFLLLFSNSYHSLQLSYSYNSLQLRLIISILTKGKKKEKKRKKECPWRVYLRWVRDFSSGVSGLCQVVWLGSRDLGFSNRDLGKRAGNFAIWTLHPGYRDERRDEFWRSGWHRLALPAVFSTS